MIRQFLSLVLCFTLLVTSLSAGAARVSERAVDQMVICSGPQTTVIYIGADGTPTQAPHHCPDCALHGLDMVFVAVPDLGTAPVFSHFVGVSAVEIPNARPVFHALARAPPRLI